jgi:hypothetical protein
MDELTLYQTDRPVWLQQVAPRMARKLEAVNDNELAKEWATLARDYQRAVWAVMDGATQSRVRKVRAA